MNPEALRKLLPIAMVVLTTSHMVSTFRWMLRMGLGEVYGLPADIVLVLSVLNFVLTAYMTLQMVRNREEFFWLMSPAGALTWKLLMTVMAIDLLIPVFEKATELV